MLRVTAFPAKYAGRCTDCNGRIEIGDSVTFVESDVVHADCTDDIETNLSRPVSVCTTCYLTLPCDCED